MAIKKVERNSFGVKQHTFAVPSINLIQLTSYEDFWKNGLPRVLSEFEPIQDASGRWQVTLGPNFVLEKSPFENEYVALLKGQTYSAPLYLDVTVENLATKEKKKQKVFVANVPLMTKKGNFIINGIQKIVVSQLVKAPGLVYTRALKHGVYEYTAKIIPVRGVWIDFVIAYDGVIYARIDRKKKFPVTQLFKLFGLSEQEILEAFADIENENGQNIIQATLDKDPTYGISECVNSIYKKLRPGDIVSIEKGQKFLLGLFQDKTRFDLGEVGRYKFDLRLRQVSKPDKGDAWKKTIDVEEFIKVIRELAIMSIEQQQPDSIDSLSYRRVRRVGEWLANTFRSGLTRVINNIKDKLTVSENEDYTPAQLVNMRPIASMIEDFFNTSQLCRFMDQTNIMSEIDQRQFITCAGPGGLTRDRAGFDVRDVQPSYYGRVCPVNTPEGPAFGINLHTAIYARVNALGFLETPYFKIKKALSSHDPELISRISQQDVLIQGKLILKNGQVVTKDLFEVLQSLPEVQVPVKPFVSKEVIYISADEESRYTIAEYIRDVDEQGQILIDVVGARKDGVPVQALVENIDLMDVASTQIFSLSTCMVPFVAQTDGLRVQMGTNQQRQAVPLLRPEVPIIATGFESLAAEDSGYLVKSPCDGVVVKSDSFGVKIKCHETQKIYKYDTIKFWPSNGHTTINQRVCVSYGEEVKKGDVIIEGFGIYNGEFAVGQNVRVAFIPFKGYNFEDAIVLSERLVQQDKFTSTHIYQLTCDVHETRLGNEVITADIPNVAIEKLKKLDKNGIVHLGAYVESGDILVGKITPKGEKDLSPEDKLIRVLFGEYSRDVRDNSMYLQHGLNGKVIAIRTFSRANGDSLPNDVLERVHIWLASSRKIKAGDKMAGRHGNKGVVSVVLPVEDMPYTEDGRPVDVVLNPLGVMSRMNLGQVLETHLGLVCEKLKTYAVTQPLNEISAETIQKELEKAGFRPDGRLRLFDGQTGEEYDHPVVVGTLYLNKLHHMVDDKIHARSTGPYSLITQQPLGGRAHSGGQRFGEMEVWALEAYGAAYALQEMLTIKSDDIQGREEAFEKIVREQPITNPNLPNSFIVLSNELTALGLKVKVQAIESQDEYRQIDKNLALSVDEGKF